MLRASVCENITLALAITYWDCNGTRTVIAYCIHECFMGWLWTLPARCL